jgi:hypothetical protein
MLLFLPIIDNYNMSQVSGADALFLPIIDNYNISQVSGAVAFVSTHHRQSFCSSIRPQMNILGANFGLIHLVNQTW